MAELHDDFVTHSKVSDIGRWYVTRFVQEVAAALPKDAVILDAGAGECAYKRFFGHCDYVAIDLAVGESAWNYGNLDIIGYLDRLPLAAESVDAVLSTQTLEHLEFPREAVTEIYRVLKPGGLLYLTAPMAHEEHQAPYDFFRYTSYGLDSICRAAGFGSIDIRPFGGIFVRWAYELPRMMSIVPSVADEKGVINWISPRVYFAGFLRGMAKVFVRAVQYVLLGLDRFDRVRKDPFGWRVVAKK